jgi:tagatose 1,6-diphosphate aldolase
MPTITIGKYRGLQQISTESGIFNITALDHRGSFVEMLGQTLNLAEPSRETIVTEKERMLRVFAPHSSAVLLDPIYGVKPMIARRALPGGVGLLVAREESGYESEHEGRLTKLLPDWDAAAVRRTGGSAVKLLLYYHPRSSIAAKQELTLKRVAEECRQQDLPLLVEPMSYPLLPGQKKSDPEFAREKPELVIETARRLVPLGVDVLKAEFPTEAAYETDEVKMRDYCRQLTAVAGIPWTLLSAGVDFPTFQRQVEIACEAGASGFVAGRAIWKEGMQMAEPEARDRFLNTVGISRLRIVVEIANYRGTAWTERIGSPGGASRYGS